MKAVERRSIRALLLTPQREVLLMKLELPSPPRILWIAPGGGARRGEAPEETLRRELFEELGLREFETGPEIWTRVHTFEIEGRRITQRERFWVVPTPRFEPTTEQMPPGIEREWFRGYRWWSLTEILRSGQIFVPRRLGPLLHDYVENGPPPSPLDAGI